MAKRKYTQPYKRDGLKDIRNFIENYEGTDFADQNKKYGGDAVKAKYKELISFYPGIQDLPTGERNALLSAYYNFTPSNFNKYYGDFINNHIDNRTKDSFNNLYSALRQRYRYSPKIYKNGIRRRALDEYQMAQREYGRYLNQETNPFEQDIHYQQWRNNLPKNLQNESQMYDLRGAYQSGANPTLEDDSYYHLPSRDSKTGQYLKSAAHPTIWDAMSADMSQGYLPQIIDGNLGSLLDPYLYKLTHPFQIQQPVYTDKYGDAISIDDEGNPYTDNRKYSSIELDPITVFGNDK